MLDVSLDDDLESRFWSVLANNDEEGIAWLLPRDNVLLGLADSGAHVSQLCDACFATDLLGPWVRDRGVMPLERAVHKLTAEPAGVYGLHDRGTVEVGQAADLCVFDPETVAPGPCAELRDFPADGERLTADAPVGVTHVLVNGQAIREDGVPVTEPAGSRPGSCCEDDLPGETSGDVATEGREVADGQGNQTPEQHHEAALPPREKPELVAVAAESQRDVPGERGAGCVREPVQVVVEDGAGQKDEETLEDQGAADGDQDPGDLVLDQRAEARDRKDRAGPRDARSPGRTAPTWSVTDDTVPPSAPFHGSPTTATAASVSAAMSTAQSAVTPTLASERTRAYGHQHE